jgi:hypothetical protein
MSERKRLHRNDPSRGGPLRNFSNLYSQPGVLNGGSKAKDSATSQEGHDKTRAEGRPGEGVGLAYRVIEKYLAEGRLAAERLNPLSYGNGATAAPLQELVERMLRQQVEMLPLWLELFGSLARVDPARTGDPARANSRPMNNGSSSKHNISLEIASRQPVEVFLDLQEHSERLALVTSGLHALRPKARALTEIRFTPRKGESRSKLSIKIPARQPSGTYSGVLVDRANGDVRGTLSIRIGRSVSPRTTAR